MGNITHIQEYAGNASATYNTYYQYDSQNQLVREDNERQGITYTYTYDRGGNLLQKKCYSYTTGNLPSTPNQQYEYTYGGATATWQDQLTGYNGETITYDGVGNPLTYRGGMEFTWQAGRKLAGMVKDGVSATYKYNSDGIRTEKVVNGVKTVYYIFDNTVVAESRSNGVNILYLFDESGTRIGMTYNGQNYYYLFNAQGDVTAIMNSSGAVEYRYVYDAWGKLIGIYNGSGQDVTDDTALTNVGYHNPIRYRGYYYDNETGLYYVSSRYYDPEIGRFISPDTTEILTATPMGLTDKNLYAYCDNNPVIRADHGGDFWNVVIGAAVGAVVGVAGQFISDLATSALNGKWTFSNWQTYAGAAVGGAVGGAILGGTGHVGLANAASGFVTTGVGMSLEKVTCASDKSWAEIGVNAVADGAISYGLGKLPGVKNVTKGRNNMSAVYRSGLTKLRNKTVSHMSKKVIGKGLVSGFVGGLAMDGYYGVKQYGYNRVRNRILRYAG